MGNLPWIATASVNASVCLLSTREITSNVLTGSTPDSIWYECLVMALFGMRDLLTFHFVIVPSLICLLHWIFKKHQSNLHVIYNWGIYITMIMTLELCFEITSRYFFLNFLFFSLILCGRLSSISTKSEAHLSLHPHKLLTSNWYLCWKKTSIFDSVDNSF